MGITTTTATLVAHSKSEIISPDSNNLLSALNAELIYYNGSNNQLKLDASNSLIYSPDGNSYVSVSNASAEITQGGKQKLLMDNQSTQISGPAGGLNDAYIEITASETFVKGDFKVQDATTNRIIANVLNTFIAGPDGSNALVVTNAGAYWNLDKIAIENDLYTTSTFVITNRTDVIIGPLTADISCLIPEDVNQFTVRDLAENIGTFTVTLIFIGGTDELILSKKNDYVKLNKVGTDWFAYNYRTGKGVKIN